MEAVQALDAGDLVAAREAYGRLLARKPGDLMASAGLAQVELVERASALDPVAVRQAALDRPDDVAAQSDAADMDLLERPRRGGLRPAVDLVRRTSGDERAQARTHLISLFDLLGPDDPRVMAAPDGPGQRPVLTPPLRRMARNGATEGRELPGPRPFDVRARRGRGSARRAQPDGAERGDAHRRRGRLAVPGLVDGLDGAEVADAAAAVDLGVGVEHLVPATGPGQPERGSPRAASRRSSTMQASAVPSSPQRRNEKHVAGGVVGVDPLEAAPARRRAPTAAGVSLVDPVEVA